MYLEARSSKLEMLLVEKVREGWRIVTYAFGRALMCISMVGVVAFR